MTPAMLWYVVVGVAALALSLVYVRQGEPKPPAGKTQQQPRWHDGFDEPV